MGYNYLGLYSIAVQNMEGDQVKFGWTMFDALDLKQKYQSVPIMVGDITIVTTLMMYTLNAAHLTVRVFCTYIKCTKSSKMIFHVG